MADGTITTKTCPHCKETLSAASYCSNRQRCDGLSFLCRDCRRIDRKRWDDANREKIRAADRVRSLARPAEVKRAAAKKWYAAHPETQRQRQAAHYAKPGKRAARNATIRAWKLANPDLLAAYDAARRAQRCGATGAGWSPADVVSVAKLQRGLCAYCRVKLTKPFHRDHIQPLTKGGAHDRRNLQLLCPPCNLSKGARDPIDHARSLGLLI